MNTVLKIFCTLLLSATAAAALAQPRPMEEGRNFEAIVPPVPTETSADIIEVVDVFWYGCPICAEFEPMMTYWGGAVRGDLVMRRMPAVWNEVMKTHARLYFTAVQLELAASAHPAAFRRIHEDGHALNDAEQVAAFFAELGVAKEDFEQAWNSPDVIAAVEKAEADTRAAGINRVPALVVNGRYRVVRNEDVPELPDVVVTANQLVKELRDNRRID